MTDPVTIGSAGVRFLKTSDAKMKMLYKISTGAKSMHDETNADYQVPVGKVFIGLRYMQSAGSGGEVWIDKNTTADTDSGGTRMFYCHYGSDQTNHFDVWLEFPAGNYVNSESGYGILTGVECDA